LIPYTVESCYICIWNTGKDEISLINQSQNIIPFIIIDNSNILLNFVNQTTYTVKAVLRGHV